MKLSDYIKSRGLTVRCVANKMKRSRQQIYAYDWGAQPTPKTVKAIADALTEYGAVTTPIDLYREVFKGE